MCTGFKILRLIERQVKTETFNSSILPRLLELQAHRRSVQTILFIVNFDSRAFMENYFFTCIIGLQNEHLSVELSLLAKNPTYVCT